MISNGWTVVEALRPVTSYTMDGEAWAEFDYKARGCEGWEMPSVLNGNGIEYVLTGHNSDTGRAYYRQARGNEVFLISHV